MIFFDTETTGLVKPYAANLGLQPYITEIYAIRLDENDNVVDEVDTLICPPVPIPDEVIKITGITNEMVRDAPAFIQVYDQLVELFLGETSLVAHNIAYDVNVLSFELERYGMEKKFPWPREHICTVEKSESIEGRRLNLSKLHAKATGRPHEDGAHRAKDDVMALIRSYTWMRNEGLV